MKRILLFLCLFTFFSITFSQSLLDDLESGEPETNYTSATFKANRILLGQSVENIKTGELNFAVMHNFGPVNGGFYEFFGLDAANTALNFEYGVSDKLNIGVGRSTYQKYFQGNVKYKILAQSDKMPITVSVFAADYLYGIKWPEDETAFENKHRHSYLAQILIARKFSSSLSVQVTPTFIHKNLVKLDADNNDLLLILSGARLKLTNRVTVNAEYSFLLPNQMESDYKNYLAVGFDLETGGHVFQLRFSNTTSLYEPNFMTKSQNQWLDGDISFGFTINRRFTIVSNSK